MTPCFLRICKYFEKSAVDSLYAESFWLLRIPLLTSKRAPIDSDACFYNCCSGVFYSSPEMRFWTRVRQSWKFLLLAEEILEEPGLKEVFVVFISKVDISSIFFARLSIERFLVKAIGCLSS